MTHAQPVRSIPGSVASTPRSTLGREGHNRWHHELEPALTIDSGDEVTFVLRDSLDGRIGPSSTAADFAAIGEVDHPLAGPVYVEGATVGGILEVEVMGIETPEYGFAGLLPGMGVLGDDLTETYLTHWELSDVARCPELPGVRIPRRPFPGIIGVAPSAGMVRAARERETRLALDDPRTLLPTRTNAIPPHAAEGLRTCPPRENGGNMDVRQLTVGARLFLPVVVEGGLLSAGDLHWCQGDGESCGTALEICGALTVRASAHPPHAGRLRRPALLSPAVNDGPSFATLGVAASTDAGESMSVRLAAHAALVDLIDCLQAAYGYCRDAAAVLCSICADLRLSQIINVPNPVVSAVLPLAVFDDPAPLVEQWGVQL
jgi:formamidase